MCVNNLSSNHSGRCNPLDASRKQAYCANHPLRRVTLQHSTQCPLRPERLPVILQSRLVSTACGLLSEVSGPSSGLRVPRTASPGPCRPKSSLVQTTLPIPLIQSNPIQTLGGVVYLLTPRSSHRQSRPRPTPDQCAPFAIFFTLAANRSFSSVGDRVSRPSYHFRVQSLKVYMPATGFHPTSGKVCKARQSFLIFDPRRQAGETVSAANRKQYLHLKCLFHTRRRVLE